MIPKCIKKAMEITANKLFSMVFLYLQIRNPLTAERPG